MIIKGKKIQGPNVEILVIPRKDEDIVFKAEAILDFSEFKRLCPEPQPPTIVKRGEGVIPNVNDPAYKKKIGDHSERRTAFIIITSLKATEGIQWETVNYDDPSTWTNYEKELRASGFSDVEIGRLINCVMQANCLDESKIEEARKRFLAYQEELSRGPSSQSSEQLTTQYGVPANGSV